MKLKLVKKKNGRYGVTVVPSKKVNPVKEARTQAGALETLWQELPEVFEPKTLPESVAEDFLFVPVDDPDPSELHIEEDGIFASSVEHTPEDLTDEEFSVEEWLIENAPSPEGIIENRFQDTGVLNAFATEYPGGLQPFPRDPKIVPPSDCHAFYLPFHFYFPDWWGIYLLAEGVQLFAAHIAVRVEGALSWRECWTAARVYLYSHEAYHHNVESFSTRLEVTHRSPLYRIGFAKFYRDTFDTDDCLEEALAEAYAFTKATSLFRQSKVKQRALGVALTKIIEASPRGYRMGVKYLGKQRAKAGQNEFAEKSHNISLPHVPNRGGRLWNTAPYSFNGFARITSRVSYVLHRGSPLADRMPMESLKRCKPSEVISKLRSLTGMELKRNGAKHDIWETSDGRRVTIPRHPRDLSTGTLRAILNQAGLKMSIAEFMQCDKGTILNLTE